MDRMKYLIELLNEASKAYYQEDREIISDFEYDKLYDELVQLEKTSGILLSDSPTQKVGYQVLSNLTKVKHESSMLSLDKTKEIDKLQAFLGDKEGLLSLKMDGLTIVLTYNNGELIQALTRGNGEIGEDITHNAKCFKNIPIKIGFKGELVLRGEAVISYDDFEKINAEIAPEDRYKNPRNLCSGTVRQLNSEISAKRNVQFIAFALVSATGRKVDEFKTIQLDWLHSIGFGVVESRIVNSENVVETVREFENNLAYNKFATDGLVLTFNDISYSLSLGNTSKFPRDSIAFKWADEKSETTLLYIDWNTSRTGLINPVAVFDPVELEGTTVNRASLHNVSIVEALELGVGDTITVYKANMIIPQVAENLTRSGNIAIPKTCPMCNGDAEIISLRDGKALKCNNPNCKAQQVNQIVHFASRNAMNIEGVSEASIEKFVKNRWINNYTDIYRLENYKDEIVALDGFGEKSYNKMIEAIEKSKEVYLYNFIYALGINQVGLSNAKLLCKKYNNDLELIKNASINELVEIDGFGEVIALEINKYFGNKENIDLLDDVVSKLRFIQEDVSDKVLIFEDKSFVITGDVYSYKNRKELQSKIEELGGKVTGSVSSKTDYLINNDIYSSSSKNKKAQEFKVPIISEQQFIDML